MLHRDGGAVSTKSLNGLFHGIIINAMMMYLPHMLQRSIVVGEHALNGIHGERLGMRMRVLIAAQPVVGDGDWSAGSPDGRGRPLEPH